MNLDSAVFYSNSITVIVPFYRDLLGFTVEYQQGDKFVSFTFPNGARLGIKKAGEAREKPGAQSVFIAVDDIQTLYKTIQEKHIQILKKLTEEKWGTEFSILDPDKNKVEFLQRKM